MEAEQNIKVSNEKEEISVKEVITILKKWASYLFTKWKIIIPFVIIGLICGYLYAKSKRTQYLGQSTFVLDEGSGRSSAMSGGLSFLGLDMGNSSAGLFNATNNIIWLYSTRLMLQKTLLTAVEYDGKKRMLIDWFIEENDLQKELNKSPAFKKVKFTSEGINPENLTLEQNTIIGICVNKIRKDYLNVGENKNTENIITVNFKSKDEHFSKMFTEEIVKNVNGYYIQTKIKKTTEEVAILQKKADSARRMMNSSIYQQASSVDAAPNANPNLQILRVSPQKKQIDVQVESGIYMELMKNLESRRMALAKETPLIQVVDEPSLPLPTLGTSVVLYTILGGILSSIMIIGILMVIFWYRSIMNS